MYNYVHVYAVTLNTPTCILFLAEVYTQCMITSILYLSICTGLYMTCNTPTPGYPSAADEAWYWQKRVLCIG